MLGFTFFAMLVYIAYQRFVQQVFIVILCHLERYYHFLHPLDGRESSTSKAILRPDPA